jgi:hypothetical protein
LDIGAKKPYGDFLTEIPGQKIMISYGVVKNKYCQIIFDICIIYITILDLDYWIKFKMVAN